EHSSSSHMAERKVQQQGRQGKLHVSESRYAGPVCCNALLGLETLNVLAPGEAWERGIGCNDYT
ncbi:MAG TPA: hypothetical protein VKD72_20170, partial [Gemmataceae bacterium]|nr:hypothetical protein [Gemmataceae bacterium]